MIGFVEKVDAFFHMYKLFEVGNETCYVFLNRQDCTDTVLIKHSICTVHMQFLMQNGSIAVIIFFQRNGIIAILPIPSACFFLNTY